MANKSEMKKIADVADLLKDDLAKLVEEQKDAILQGLMDLAKGTFKIVDDLDENFKVIKRREYTKLPDKDVAKYLIDQFIGKAVQKVEMSGDPDKPLVIQIAPEIAKKYVPTLTGTGDPSMEVGPGVSATNGESGD